jgi:plasmid stability protein
MGDMRVKIDEGLLTKLENLAHSHNRSLEEQVNDLLRAALEDRPARESFVTVAKRIAAMTPKDIKQIDSVELLREDRNR